MTEMHDEELRCIGCGAIIQTTDPDGLAACQHHRNTSGSA